MNWLIQNAMFGDEFGYDNFIAAIDATGQRRIDLDYVFWEQTIDLKLTDTLPEDNIPFGTRSFTRFGMKSGWKTFWDETYEYYSLLSLGDEFINHDMTVDKIDDIKIPESLQKVYIRKASGFNIIKGKVISAYAWPQWADGFKVKNKAGLENAHDWHLIDGNSLFVWAPIKSILEEYRLWVINRKVVTASLYVTNNEIVYRNADDNLEVISYAQKIIDKYPLIGTDNFVIDVFRTKEGLKIGEINCIHCSGWYAIDSRKVVNALVNYD